MQSVDFTLRQQKDNSNKFGGDDFAIQNIEDKTRHVTSWGADGPHNPYVKVICRVQL